MKHWILISGEYPPQSGGVADYTALVAAGLAAMDVSVEVWAPSCFEIQGKRFSPVTVRRVPDSFGPRAISSLSATLRQARQPCRLLVQYLPHNFGYKAMNLPFCLWLLQQSRRHEIWTVFHEVAFPLALRNPLKHNFLGIVNRAMAMLVARASRRIFVTIPAWEAMLRPMIPASQRVEWLPVPATVPAGVDPAARSDVRRALEIPGDTVLIGHFGTYSPAIAAVLHGLLPALLATTELHVLLLGRGSTEFATTLTASHPTFSPRIHAAAGLPPEAVSAHLSACDLMVQPYPDGISCRRTSAMASLSLGVPMVTNLGHLSEPLWKTCDAVELAVTPAVEEYVGKVEGIIADPARRARLAERARAMYVERFCLERTIEILRAR